MTVNTCEKTRLTPHPDESLLIDMRTFREFPRDFFRQDTVTVARALIGGWIAKRVSGRWYGARIVETEAYLGSGDPAAHSCRGRRTPRVEPMYSDGGHLYVYLVYGLHHCANVVTRSEGIAEAVLLRAAEAPAAGKERAAKAAPPSGVKLLSGPGKLCRALTITAAASGLDLLSGGAIRLFQNPGSRCTIGVSRRIGVDYAGEAAQWPLRFFDIASRAVSGPAARRNGNLRNPPIGSIAENETF